MPNQQIQHSLHGREIGLGLKNELILRDEARGGLNDAQALIWSIARVNLTTAQILALRGTEIAIVAAPGALKAVIVDHVECFLDWSGGTGYTAGAGEDLSFRYTDNAGIEVVPPIDGAAFIAAVADTYAYSWGVVTDAAQGMVPTVNAAVVATMNSGEVTLGDSPVVVNLYYRIVDTVLTV